MFSLFVGSLIPDFMYEILKEKFGSGEVAQLVSRCRLQEIGKAMV
jgi:hypothetical protein